MPSQVGLDNHQFLQALITTNPDLIYIYDLPASRVIYTNQDTARMLAYSTEEIAELGSDFFFKAIHPDDIPTWKIHQQRLQRAADGEVIEMECRIVHQDGSHTWIVGRETVFSRNDSGAPWLILGVGHDITERRTTREALIRSEERFRVALQSSQVAVFNQDRQLCYTWIYNPVFGMAPTELLGRSDADIFENADDATTLMILKRRVMDTGIGERQVIRLTRHGFTSYFDLSVEPLRDTHGEIMGVTCASSDITPLIETQNAEREQRKLAEALRDAANIQSQSSNLRDVLQNLLNLIDQVVPCDLADIMLIEEGWFTVAAHRGYEERGLSPIVSGMQAEVAQVPLFSHIIQTKQFIILPDVTKSDQWVRINESLHHRSYIGVPVILGDTVVGFLNVTSDTADYFTERHAEKLSNFAGQVAIAIQHNQLLQKLQEMAVLEERQRLARDLHDAVSQTLFSASLLAETLPRLFPDQVDSIPPYLDRLDRLNKSALAEMRNLLIELRMTKDMPLHIPDLLNQLAQAAKGRKDIEISITTKSKETLAPPIALVFYRIAQESLNNIIKHAKTDKVDITYDSTPTHAYLSVKDHGVGFDATQKSWSSMGLNIMQERAASINAKLDIQSALGQGTEVTLEFTH